MTKTKLNLIVAFVSVALLALIAFQVYWISMSYRMEEEQFDKDVRRALVNTIETSFEHQLKDADEFILAAASGDVIKDSLLHSVHVQVTGDNVVERSTLDSIIIKEFNVSKKWNSEGNYIQAQAITVHDNDSISSDSLISSLSTSIKLMFSSSPKTPDFGYLDSVLKVEIDKLGLGDHYMFGVLSSDAKELLYASSEDINLDFLAGEESYHSPLFTGLEETHILSVYFPNRLQLILRKVLIALGISILLVLAIGGSFIYILRIVMMQKKLSEMKNDFINNMTHELKTPIANIGLSLEALTQFGFIEDLEKRDQYLSIARKENKRLSGLVEQVLKAAAFDKGMAGFNIEEVDLHELLNEVVDAFKVQVEERKGSLLLDLNASQSKMMIDRGHMKSVILNLLDNANKYSPNAPEIKVETKSGPDGIELSVCDKGMGISKSNQQNIFKRFYRVNTGDQHNVKGYGMGLSYVIEVLQYHGGGIRVDSQLGKGSRFTMYLPLK